MKTLQINQDSFDRKTTFRVSPLPYSRCKLIKDYHKENDGIYWVMQSSAMLKSHYDADEVAETERLDKEEPLQKDEVVLIDGAKYKFKYLGNYSDCGIFEPVAE